MAHESRKKSSGNQTITRVLGIDPGTRVLGWAVLERDGTRFRLIEAGAIVAKGEVPARLARIMTELTAVVDRLELHEAAVESIFVGRNYKTALRTGEGRGVVLAVLGRRGLPVAEYPTRLVKRAVTGHGGASKEQVARMVCMQLGLKETPKPDDVTDACAVALTHLIRREMPQP